MKENKTNRKIREGIVVNNKMHKTIIVKVMRLSKHNRYNRTIKQFNKFKVHDEKNQTKIGDLVRIEETRPISKDKRWRLMEVLK